ncbi:putative secreted protein [Undibacterium sp. GrIS 1.2]|uniref:Spy/CpxP family protein refolding chaperone n=1 Tax=Undibacterium sp. GrIS 1.2 TaxID=3143933 RepID=UPI003390C61C
MAPIKNPIAIALAAISMCIAIGVSAQTSPAAPTSAAVPPPPHQKAGMDQAKWAEKMQERMAKHIAELHDKLKITAAQEPAWKTFIESTKPSMPPGAQAMRPDHKEMDK